MLLPEFRAVIARCYLRLLRTYLKSLSFDELISPQTSRTSAHFANLEIFNSTFSITGTTILAAATPYQ